MDKEICPICKTKREIVNTEKTGDTKKEVKFSCGHKLIKICVKDEIKVKETLGLKGKSMDKDSRGKPLTEFKTRVTDGQQVTYEKDRTTGKTKVMQKVWKKGKDGKMRPFHFHDKTEGKIIKGDQSCMQPFT